MFDETGTERTVETVESSTEAMEQANLELTTETMGQEGLEQGAGQENLELESSAWEAPDLEGVMDALDLTPDERAAFAAIDSHLPDMPVENASGNAKVYGDCTYTTCSYTTTYYSCVSTKP